MVSVFKDSAQFNKHLLNTTILLGLRIYSCKKKNNDAAFEKLTTWMQEKSRKEE